MRELKNKYIKLLPCIISLVIFTCIGYYNLKEYYDEIANSTGLISEDIEKEVKEENEKAVKDNQKYQELLKENEDNSQPEGGLLKEAEDNGSQSQEITNPVIPDLNLYAKAALLLDAKSNRVLYEENGNKRMPMASTTKIMTCIVALENADLNGVVTVSSYAASMPDVQLNIKKGEQYYLKDLLYSLMLESHNDTAVAIAEYVGGSVEGFATLMNDKARTLGCENTNFITPNGLDAEGHYTTAKDLAVIASYAIKNEQFISITNTPSYSFEEINKKRKFTVTNKNRFLYMMEGAIGVKTGFTGDAGYCFVGAVQKDDKTLVSVVLGCGWPPNKSLKWHDTKELMSYGVKNYKEKQIFQEVNLDPVFVKDGQKRYELLNIKGDISLLMRDDEKVKVVYDIPKQLKAPVKANTVVGKASYYIDDTFYTEIPIYAAEDIKKIDFKFCIDKILRLWSGND